MLFAVKFLLVFMVIVASATAKEVASLQAEFKDHLKWAKENLEKTQKKIATLQQEEKDDSSCPSRKCQIKNLQALNSEQLQIPSSETHTNQDKSEEPQEKILVFVSFSMPEASLKSLAQDMTRVNAVLILRGLIEDSFKVTAERLKDYPQGVEVNPELFEKYDIHQVPTFVKVKGEQEQPRLEQARLSGNVTLAFAAQKLKEAS
jgi:conjugal transfer pilus assembly protein TrbC